jgi:hypothetical protein
MHHAMRTHKGHEIEEPRVLYFEARRILTVDSGQLIHSQQSRPECDCEAIEKHYQTNPFN